MHEMEKPAASGCGEYDLIIATIDGNWEQRWNPASWTEIRTFFKRPARQIGRPLEGELNRGGSARVESGDDQREIRHESAIGTRRKRVAG